MSKLFLTLLASTFVISLYAQDSTSVNRQASQNKKNAKRDRINNLMRMEEEGDLIFNKHNIFAIRLATDGYGISFEKGKYKTPSRTLLYEFELNEIKDPKEHRISATSDGFNYTSVVPYKLNNLYEFKVAIGQQHLIGGKGNKNGVAVTALYAGGLTLGMQKPYFLDIQNQITGQTSRLTFAQVVNDSTQGDAITGASGFTVGWDHLTLKPAVNAKQAMRFDYGRLNQTITAIEAGLTEEFYFSKIPLVYLVPQRQFFFNAYISILFGSRK
ncbi:MAG TPA: hypothetical protein VNU72_03440 [Puia sp.]|nr:hypothetical protein [Puia sp.]